MKDLIYGLPRDRYKELYHFVRQYNTWNDAARALEKSFMLDNEDWNMMTKATSQYLYYKKKINVVIDACMKADVEYYAYLLLAITNELTYEELQKKYSTQLPFKKIELSEMKQRFWRTLNILRD